MAFRLDGYIVNDDEKWIYDCLEITTTSPKNIREWLESNDCDSTLYINSFGGSLFAGVEIYQMLIDHGGINVTITGLAASAASIVPMGAKHVKINPAGSIMIHNASMQAQGNYKDMQHASEELQVADKGIRNAYRARTKLSDSELAAMLDAETWMDAEEALRMGFVDEIALPLGQQLSTSVMQNSMESWRGLYNAMRCPSAKKLEEHMNQPKAMNAMLLAALGEQNAVLETQIRSGKLSIYDMQIKINENWRNRI